MMNPCIVHPCNFFWHPSSLWYVAIFNLMRFNGFHMIVVAFVVSNRVDWRIGRIRKYLNDFGETNFVLAEIVFFSFCRLFYEIFALKVWVIIGWRYGGSELGMAKPLGSSNWLVYIDIRRRSTMPLQLVVSFKRLWICGMHWCFAISTVIRL